MIPLLAVALLASTATPDYKQTVEEWRAQRETRLKADDGWLTLTGLFWLREGENPTGLAEGSRVVLPAGFPPKAGSFTMRGDTVTWRPASGKPRPVATDKGGKPDIVEIGRLKLYVIDRGGKLGVRMKDPESQFRREFKGLSWFPTDPKWLVKARFVVQPRMIVFDAQAGDKQLMKSPGFAVWTMGGRTLRLTPVVEGDQLFWVFRDQTAGKSTYPAARFIYTDHPKDGQVVIDFNKAYNPPCVFTPYATCPLPPPENRLPMAVEAGEKMYGAQH